jgi:Abortive infection C-terminus
VTRLPFSPRVIEALVEAVTGGSAAGSGRPVGIYRSAGRLGGFFAKVDIEVEIGNGSRVPTVRDVLNRLNREPGGPEKIADAIVAVAHPDENPDEETAAHVVAHMNRFLERDGMRLVLHRDEYRLVPLASSATAVTAALRQASEYLDFDAVGRHFDSALSEADSNPEGAVTAACGIVESVGKSILDELGVPHPDKQDVQGIVREVQRHLDLAPGRPDLDPDIRQILSGLTTVTNGIGALRTHGGDAHGQGKGVARVEPPVARLAIHAASTVAFFFIEKWQGSSARSSETTRVRRN